MVILDAFEALTPPPPPEEVDNLGKAIRAYMNGLPNQISYVEYLRGSGMYFLCPREFVLNYWNPRPNKSFDAKAMMMVNLGTMFHHYMQTWILGPMGVLKGTWRKTTPEPPAYSEVLEVKGFHPDPERAIWEMQHQDEPTWEFVEDEVWSEEYRIKGHHDGVISKARIQYFVDSFKLVKEDALAACKRVHDIVDGETCLLEMKSNGKWTYDKINESKDIQDYYKMQACVYQWLTGQRETYFLLIERDMFGMKGIQYKYQPGFVKDAKYKAQVIWESIRDRRLPEAMMACRVPTDKRAKECVHATECWSRRLDFPKWVEECIAKQPERKWLDLSGLKYDG